jgi:hypothetical protein
VWSDHRVKGETPREVMKRARQAFITGVPAVTPAYGG